MILHLFPNEKFTYDYVTRINRLFDEKQHIFLVYGKQSEQHIKKVLTKNVIYVDNFNKVKYAFTLILLMKKANKIIIHSLFLPWLYLIIISLLSPILKKKLFWNIWGSDLYNSFWDRNNSIKLKIKELFRRHFIKNVMAVGYIQSDYDFLLSHYKTKAKFYLSSYTYDFNDVIQTKQNNDKINILLGNSATRECRYLQTINQLKNVEQDLNVYCILSYPNTKDAEQYRKEVVKYAQTLIPKKFFPVVDFMKYDDYIKLLSTIDIAIFNQNRQQALGNIASLLFLQKTVYINEKNGCYRYFKEMGCNLYKFNDEEMLKLELLNETELKTNSIIIKDFFSDEKFYERWHDIFNFTID